MNRLGLKIVCLVASVVIWIQVASHSTVEQNVHLPLVVMDLADEFTLEGSDLPDEILVRVEGSKLRLVLHSIFQVYIGEIRINLWNREPASEFYYEIQPSDVYTELRVVSIQTQEHPRIVIDRQEFRLLPVVQTNTGRLRDDLAFLENPTLKPDSILVSGPSRFFHENSTVEAEGVDFSKIRQSERMSVQLIRPGENLHLTTSQVSLDVLVAEKEDRTLANIPVIPLVDAGRPPVGISPPVVDVMVRGVSDSVSILTADRFVVTVPVGDLDEGIYNLTGQVDHPDWLEIIGLDPPRFQVIVGQPTVSLDSLFEARGTVLDSGGGRDE